MKVVVFAWFFWLKLKYKKETNALAGFSFYLTVDIINSYINGANTSKALIKVLEYKKAVDFCF
ncbi:hypothetical protein [Algibacter sp.]|uniref:hypothetical protein n=1 Tax=Algibacter sp. TaxID=1872428 RepID=UPI003C763897